MVASFTLHTTTGSMARDVMQCRRILEERQLEVDVGPMSTSVQGDWDAVFAGLTQCRNALLQDGRRLAMTVLIDDRQEERRSLSERVAAVDEP